MRPDKPKVVDEVWDDERIRSFLSKQPLGPAEHADFSKLLYAYRSMRPADFERFVELYVEAGGDPRATDRRGRTLTDVIADHRRAGPFREALARAGG